MRVLRPALAALALSLVAAGSASAQIQHTLTYAVNAINELSVSGTPSLTVSTAVAGSPPTSATGTASYSITTNQTGTAIQANLGTALPSGLTLEVQADLPTVSLPSAATRPASPVQLSTTAATIATMTRLNAASQTLNYTLSATSQAGVIASTNVNVVFTIVAGS